MAAGEEGSVEDATLSAQISQPHARLEQRVWAGNKGRVSNVSLTAVHNLADRVFYFDLQVLERVADKQQPTMRAVDGRVGVRPGTTYIVRVSVSLNEYQPVLSQASWALKQRQVRIQRELDLFLEARAVSGWSELMADVVGQNARLALESWDGWHHDFEVTLPSNQPSGNMVFTLLYRDSESTTLSRDATTLTLVIEGDSDRLPAPMFRFLSVDAQPPPNTAILYVRAGPEEQLQLMGWLRDRVAHPLGLEPIERPAVRPEEYYDELAYLEAVSQRVHDYAIDNPANVIGWLTSVLDRYGGESCVVIVDEADSGIPWEMLKLTGRRYLGAHARVVRWTEAQYRDQAVRLQLDETLYYGRLAAMVDPANSPGQRHPTLRQLAPRPSTSSDELQDDLLIGSSPVGMIYVESSSLLAYGDEQDLLAGSTATQLQGKAMKVRFDEVEGILEPRPMFFANAPYSGRILLRGRRAHGLARAVLAQVAAGYIGALGPIEQTHASEIAERLLSAASKPEGVQPAELLRQVRLEIAERLSDRTLVGARRRELERQLRYTFMYVYYGSPHARLRLQQPLPDSSEGRHAW